MPKIASNFQLGAAQPIDSRFVVKTIVERDALKVYDGLETYVEENSTKYIYKNNEWIDYKSYLDITQNANKLSELSDLIDTLKIDEWNNEIGAKENAATAQSKANSAYTLAESKEAAGTAQALINSLDKTITGANSNKTLKLLSQTDGFINAEFQDISITKSQISDFNESDYDAAGSADNALTDSKNYTNDGLSKHNTDATSHSDIRQLTSDHNVNNEAHSDIRQLISNLNAKEGLDKTGTVTSVKISAGAGLSVDNANAITTSGTRTLSLAASGVNAATYGPNANVTGTDGATIKIPEITVDTYGRVTSVTERIYTSKDTNTHITVDSGLNSTSTNPVQNKVINAKFESLNDAYDSKGSAAAAESAAKAYVDGIVESYLTGDGAADTIDTLKEIANWIKDDQAGAAKIISDVSTNAQDIVDLKNAVAGRLKFARITIDDSDGSSKPLGYLKNQLQTILGKSFGFVNIVYKDANTSKLYEMYVNMESTSSCYAMSFSDNTTYEINDPNYTSAPFKIFMSQYKLPKVPALPLDGTGGYYLLAAYRDSTGNTVCKWELDNTVRVTTISEE